jgi:hypothetical protein
MRKATVAGLLILLTGLLPLGAYAQLTESTMTPIRLPVNVNKPTSVEKDSTLEAILKPQELTTSPVQPISLAGIKIPGVNPNTIAMLGMNHFVVINNTTFETMGELYRDNRLKGKPNFVTLDSIVHPYFATTNALIAAVVEEHAMPDLKQIMTVMLKTSVEDYRHCEDIEVKDDIQRNLAFIIIALRLLEPSIKLPDMGGATDLSNEEMRNIESGFKTRSVIFDREENFQALAPIGWFAKREKLSNFYRCAQWISRMDFPLTDVTVDTETGSGNLFRRSVLLYRALDRAVVDGKPASEMWQRLVSVWELFATSSIRHRQKTLLYTDFKAVVPSGNQDLKSTLNNLASPFFRTKLLLSVRKQKPVGLGTTSIFELADPSGSGEQQVAYRLMPLIEDPEMPWLRARASHYADEETSTVWCPLSLLILHARGAQAATNILYNGLSTLQPDLNKLIPELERMVAKPKGAQPSIVAWERSWQILSGYFKQFPGEAQAPLKTDLWLSRHLESAFAGWVDSHLAFCELPTATAAAPDIAPKPAPAPAAAAGSSTAPSTAPPSAPSSAPPAAPSAAPSSAPSAQSTPPVKPATFHYLEPVPAVFRAIEADAKTLEEKLTALNYFPARYKQRLDDFMRLANRLAQIADKEIAGQPTTPVDFKLLAGIDFVLDQISSPLAGSLAIIAPTNAPAGGGKAQANMLKSANLVLGRPGLVLMLCQTSQGAMLVRGGLYTYYELSGSPLRAEHIKRKLQFDLLRPPIWARTFDVIQETAAKEPPPRKVQ